MFNVLITGKLLKAPKNSTGKNGSPYTTASVRVPIQGQREDEPDSVFASVIAFGEDAEKLGRLVAGDTVSVSGMARLSTWEKDGKTSTGLNVTATGILSAYELKKRRGSDSQQVRQNTKPNSGDYPRGSESWGVFGQTDQNRDFDDPITF